MPETRTDSKRQRLVTWDDPFEEAHARSGMGGLEYMQAVKEGRIAVPPIWSLVGLRLAEIDAGHAVMEIDPAEYHYNPFGVVQGGLLCVVLDAALGCAVHSLLPASAGLVSLELNTGYFRPVSARSGRIRCEGSIIHIHSGSRIIGAEARMMDGKGMLYARATAICMILDQDNRNVD
jgi:uncharacterized protein (TIGR00369 family)